MTIFAYFELCIYSYKGEGSGGVKNVFKCAYVIYGWPHSAKFIDTQRLPQLNFRINFLQQMKSGTEIDMVHHWIQVCIDIEFCILIQGSL